MRRRGHTEIDVELQSASVDAQGLEFGVGVNLPISADYFVSEALSLGVGFAKSNDNDAISVNARYNF